MKRAFLEALGLDKESVDKIMAEHGASVESQKTKVTDLTTERDDLKNQLSQRDTDLKDLKKKADGSEDLQKQLTDLQTKYDTEKGEHDEKVKKIQLSSALKLALAGKVHDADIAIGQIDEKLIELDAEGKVTKGLDEQLKTLQESKPFLFIPETTQTLKGVIPVTPIEKDKDGNPVAGSYGKQLAETSNQGAKELADAQKSYFD